LRPTKALCNCGSFEILKAAALPTRKSVFLVDDDPSMLKGMRRLLREYGFDTEIFESADALLRKGDFGKASCIILDINLGGMSGIDLRHRLAGEGVSLPVIYITGKDSIATREAAMESGCVAYLTKPFAAKSLIEPVERASSAAA
jgi:FixJ family two-component response regulator